MRYAVTGATGLLGGNLVRLLCAEGHQVVATRRSQRPAPHLQDLAGLSWADAGLDDGEALARAFEGCDGVFHCAAQVSIRTRVTSAIEDANVHGTGRVLEAARRAGARLVHCSTVSAVGLSTDGAPVDEGARWNMPEHGLGDAYATTKHRAEALVLDAARAGADAVVVNPGFMIGPYDAKPSSGRIVLDLIHGRVPGYTLGTNSFVDVRDVARGMLAAMRRGTRAERYILAGHNLTYRAFFDLVSEVTGAPPVRRRVPGWLVRALGRVGDLSGLLTGGEPFITGAAARWALNDRYLFTSAKAEATLGYRISPLEPAIADAAAWFRAQGMVRR